MVPIQAITDIICWSIKYQLDEPWWDFVLHSRRVGTDLQLELGVYQDHWVDGVEEDETGLQEKLVAFTTAYNCWRRSWNSHVDADDTITDWSRYPELQTRFIAKCFFEHIAIHQGVPFGGLDNLSDRKRQSSEEN